MDMLTSPFPTGLPQSVQTIIRDLARENGHLHRALTYLRVELEQIAIDQQPEYGCGHAEQALAALESVLSDAP